MPPRKAAAPSSKSLDGDEASTLILQYLTAQNRPYSAADISSNLHNKVSKAKADKALREMLERGEIAGKASGKQWVFWCLQDAATTATPAELAAMDASIETLRARISDLKPRLKAQQTALATLRSTPSTTTLATQIAALQERRRDLETALAAAQQTDGGAAAATMSRDDVLAVEHQWAGWRKKAAGRKRMFEDVEALLLEGMPREELWDKLGIDMDEA